MQSRLCENDDQLRPTISVIVDGSISQQRLRHKLQENSEIHFLPAISGGDGPKEQSGKQPAARHFSGYP